MARSRNGWAEAWWMLRTVLASKLVDLAGRVAPREFRRSHDALMLRLLTQVRR